MQKIDVSQSCNAAASTLGHEHEENEYEDSDAISYNKINMENMHLDDGGSSFSENSEEAERDGDEHADFWAITDEDEDQSQDLDMYEADCEDQDTDMDSDEEDHQNIDANEDEDEISNLKPNKENLEESSLFEGNLHNPTPTSPQLPESNPLSTPEPHHETIALGQHHLWMM